MKERTVDFEYGIDKFQVGQLVNLSFPGLSDDDIAATEGEVKEYIPPQLLPGVVLSSHPDDDNWPRYNVGFFTRYATGGYSGYLNLIDFCAWRFLYPDQKPPQWILDKIIETHHQGGQWMDGVPNEDLFYIQEKEDGTPYKVYVIETEEGTNE